MNFTIGKNLNAEDLTSKEDAFLASKNHETHLFGFYQIFSWELYAHCQSPKSNKLLRDLC